MELDLEDDFSGYIQKITQATARCMIIAALSALLINAVWFFFDDFLKTFVQEVFILLALIFSVVSMRLSRRGYVLKVLRGYGVFGILLGMAIVWSSGDAFVFTGFFILVISSLVAVFAYRRKEGLFWSLGSFLGGIMGLFLRYRFNFFGSGHSGMDLLHLAIFNNLIMGTLIFLGLSISAMLKKAIISTSRQKRRIEGYAEELGNINIQLYHSSITDILTGLNNRLKLDEILLAEKERADRYEGAFALILLDLDFFKQINDNHGHQIGDEVLKGVAAFIKNTIRKSDIGGRWGGEEFLVICPETSLDSAVILAEKIRERIGGYHFPEGIRTTASFGVSEYISEERIADVLFRVDSAMYLAKGEGRNRTKALKDKGAEKIIKPTPIQSV